MSRARPNPVNCPRGRPAVDDQLKVADARGLWAVPAGAVMILPVCCGRTHLPRQHHPFGADGQRPDSSWHPALARQHAKPAWLTPGLAATL
jgi:hypothetical protein